MYKRIALVITGALLAGCTPIAAPRGPTEITVLKHLAGDTEEAADKAAIDRFNASQTRWRVTVQSLPQGSYSQSIVAASLAGQMPCVLTVDSPKLASFVWAGYLRPVDDALPAALLGDVSPAAIGRYQDHVYAVGQFDAALALYTRRSTLAALGTRIPTLDHPWSRTEFDTLLHQLKASGKFAYPLDLQTRDTKADWWTYAFSPMLQSFGGDLIDRSTMRTAQGKLNGADAVAFGSWFQSLFRDGLVNRREPDENAFVTGRAAIAYTGNWWKPVYARKLGTDLLILPPPDLGHGAAIGGGSWQWAISKTCAHPDGAGAFLRFLMQPREIAAMADAAGMVPVSTAGANLSAHYRPGGDDRVFFNLIHRFARPRPATPAYAVISNSFFDAMRNIMDGAKVPDALDDAVDTIGQSLADNGYYAHGAKP